MAEFNFSSQKLDQDLLRIDFTKKKIRFEGNVVRFRDKDTRQIVVYIESLDISGYGNTGEKANEMASFLLKDFFNWLVNQPQKRIDDELRALGWRHVKYKNKEYSRSYVDGDGNLKDFNAVGDEVERLSIVA